MSTQEESLKQGIPPHQRIVAFIPLKRRFYEARYGLRGPSARPDDPIKDLQIQFFVSEESARLGDLDGQLFWSEPTSQFPAICADVAQRVLVPDPAVLSLAQTDLRSLRASSHTAVSWHLKLIGYTQTFIVPVETKVLELLDELDRQLEAVSARAG